MKQISKCIIKIIKKIAHLLNDLSAMQETRFGSWMGKIPWSRDRLPTPVFLGSPGDTDCKESACNARDLVSMPWLGRSLVEGHGNPLQDSGLENLMDRGA